MSMMVYTQQKYKELAKFFLTSTPANARCMLRDIQSEINDEIKNGLMSDLVTEEIVKEVRNSRYTPKVGTQDTKGHENISIITRYLNKNNEVHE